MVGEGRGTRNIFMTMQRLTDRFVHATKKAALLDHPFVASIKERSEPEAHAEDARVMAADGETAADIADLAECQTVAS